MEAQAIETLKLYQDRRALGAGRCLQVPAPLSLMEEAPQVTHLLREPHLRYLG